MAGSSQSAPRSRHPGLSAETAPFGDTQRPVVDATLFDGYREALVGVPVAEGGGAVSPQGCLSWRYQERERACDQRKLAAPDGLRTLQAHLPAGESYDHSKTCRRGGWHKTAMHTSGSVGRLLRTCFTWRLVAVER